jgi:hypothetical protein
MSCVLHSLAHSQAAAWGYANVGRLKARADCPTIPSKLFLHALAKALLQQFTPIACSSGCGARGMAGPCVH